MDLFETFVIIETTYRQIEALPADGKLRFTGLSQEHGGNHGE
jgi:hypothetical protein